MIGLQLSPESEEPIILDDDIDDEMLAAIEAAEARAAEKPKAAALSSAGRAHFFEPRQKKTAPLKTTSTPHARHLYSIHEIDLTMVFN